MYARNSSKQNHRSWIDILWFHPFTNYMIVSGVSYIIYAYHSKDVNPATNLPELNAFYNRAMCGVD